jgi:hypothetical protein
MSDSMIQPHVCIVADCHSFAAMGSNVLFVGAESDSVRKRSAPRTDGSNAATIAGRARRHLVVFSYSARAKLRLG